MEAHARSKIWITYAWADNETGDIDFIAQELSAAGLNVKLDRWNIEAGQRLWDQIQRFISSKAESDAWLLVATQNSLESEACKEEFAYALDRALRTRGENYPIVALFRDSVDSVLIPPAIRIRLHISLTDPDWKERILAAAEQRAPVIMRAHVETYQIQIHPRERSGRIPIEVRPRAGVWAPVMAAIPIDEKDKVNMSLMVGPSGIASGTGIVPSGETGPSNDGQWWTQMIRDQATPTRSLYIRCDTLPSKIVFGPDQGPQHLIPL